MTNPRISFCTGLAFLLVVLGLLVLSGRQGLAATAERPSNDLTIESVIWGKGNRTMDVTAQVVEMLRSHAAPFVIDYRSFNTDPAPGVSKQLVVIYKFHDVTHTLRMNGGQQLSYTRLIDDAIGNQTSGGTGPQILTPEQMAGVVLIEGDKGVATGFIAKVQGESCVVTNLHVLGDNEKLTVKTLDGKELIVQGIVGAIGADIALLKILNLSEMPAPLVASDDVLHTTKIGGRVVVVGNRLGGGVATQTVGQINGIGPARIELDAPFQHGNSGSPIFDVITMQVLGVAAYVSNVTVNVQANGGKSTAELKRETRWFGYRLDTVMKWESIDWARWHSQTQQVNEFQKNSMSLLAAVKGQFAAAKDSNPHLRAIIETYDAALGRIAKANSSTNTPTTVDLNQLRDMISSLRRYADADVSEFVNAEYYDYFRNGVYWESNVPQQAKFRQELVKTLQNIESDVQSFQARLRP